MFKTLNPSMPLLVRDYPAEYLQRERERHGSVLEAAPEGYDAAHVPPISDAFVVFDLGAYRIRALPRPPRLPPRRLRPHRAATSAAASPTLRFGLEDSDADVGAAAAGDAVGAVELPETKRPQVGFALRRLMVDVEGLGADEIDEVFRRVVEKAQTYPTREGRDLPPASV